MGPHAFTIFLWISNPRMYVSYMQMFSMSFSVLKMSRAPADAPFNTFDKSVPTMPVNNLCTVQTPREGRGLFENISPIPSCLWTSQYPGSVFSAQRVVSTESFYSLRVPSTSNVTIWNLKYAFANTCSSFFEGNP